MLAAELRRIVLVPNEIGLRSLAQHPRIEPVLYRLGEPPGPGQEQAEILVLESMPPIEPALEFIGGLPRLKFIQLLVSGFEPWIGRLPPGVAMANARSAHGGAVAEWVAAVLLAHYRELAAFNALQAAQSWSQRVTASLEGKAIAVIGAGDIGRRIQLTLEPFGCEVTLIGRTTRGGVIALRDFTAIRREQDAIVLAVPVTSETLGMVGAPFLAAMKDNAVLVNAGRGRLVDTSALLAESGRIHAILDVTDPEPLPPGHALWRAPGITITPHIAGATEGCWTRGWQVAVRQIEAYLSGRAPENLVIPAR